MQYAVLYVRGDAWKTAFVLRGGFITRDWGFHINHLQPEDLESVVILRAALDASGLGKLLGSYQVKELEAPRYASK